MVSARTLCLVLAVALLCASFAQLDACCCKKEKCCCDHHSSHTPSVCYHKHEHVQKPACYDPPTSCYDPCSSGYGSSYPSPIFGHSHSSGCGCGCGKKSCC